MAPRKYLPFVRSGLAIWFFNKILIQPVGICDSLFLDPMMFTMLAFLVNDMFQTLEMKQKFFDRWVKYTTVGCASWFIWDLINGETIISIAATARFMDFFMAVIQTIIATRQFEIKKLLINPTYLVVDIFCSKKIVPTRDESDLGEIFHLVAIILEYFLWSPYISQWSAKHCFIDGMFDISTPFGLYSTTMIIIMYLNMVSYLRYAHIYHITKIILIALSFYNMTFALGIFFIYTLG
ncbi:MAG: hypothetical protein Hyperionvirus10_59 [Hyperionvirus sp.]|uniref:Uncharacterized protein n=1 Tax=Hyperionvirus sp. TaxID=2487770 RepID=A0A3G5ACW3_9VIRU|nr:MAG: hypothetical protein Hyperionvirus10_59 [Hyperionvirus sp.]